MRGKIDRTAKHMQHASINPGTMALAESLIKPFRALTLQVLNRAIPHAPQVLGDFGPDPRDPFEIFQRGFLHAFQAISRAISFSLWRNRVNKRGLKGMPIENS